MPIYTYGSCASLAVVARRASSDKVIQLLQIVIVQCLIMLVITTSAVPTFLLEIVLAAEAHALELFEPVDFRLVQTVQVPRKIQGRQIKPIALLVPGDGSFRPALPCWGRRGLRCNVVAGWRPSSG